LGRGRSSNLDVLPLTPFHFAKRVFQRRTSLFNTGAVKDNNPLDFVYNWIKDKVGLIIY
jgi:hypothetical protein